MTAAPVLRSTYVPIKVTSDYDDIIRRYLYCLLIKQAPKHFLGLTSLRSIRGKELIESLLSDDNNLHQPIVKAFGAYNRVSETFVDDYFDTNGGPGTTTWNSLEATYYAPCLAAGPPRLLHRTEIKSSTLQCFNQLSRAIFEEDLYPMALTAARNALESRPLGVNADYYQTAFTIRLCKLSPYMFPDKLSRAETIQWIKNTIGIWDNWMIEKIFSALPYNHIGEIAKYNPGALYACALDAEWFDSRYTRGRNGDVKILLCVYSTGDRSHCDPDERGYDPYKYAPIRIDFYKKF